MKEDRHGNDRSEPPYGCEVTRHADPMERWHAQAFGHDLRREYLSRESAVEALWDLQHRCGGLVTPSKELERRWKKCMDALVDDAFRRDGLNKDEIANFASYWESIIDCVTPMPEDEIENG
jgi:hypothetical protein